MHGTRRYLFRQFPLWIVYRVANNYENRIEELKADLRFDTFCFQFTVPPEERPKFLQRLHMLAEGLPIAAQLEWDLMEAKDKN